jgi:hypothetical protein
MAALYGMSLELMPGVSNLLATLQAEGVRTAVMSSSYRVLVDAVLAQGVGPFELTLAGDEVARGKPDPEPYLTAAQRLRRPRPLRGHRGLAVRRRRRGRPPVARWLPSRRSRVYCSPRQRVGWCCRPWPGSRRATCAR